MDINLDINNTELNINLDLNNTGLNINLDSNPGVELLLDFGLPGPPGPPGPPGGEKNVYRAACLLGGHRIVYLEDAGQVAVAYADNTNFDHLNRVVGVTVESALAGTPIMVQYQGLLTDPAFTFVEGPVYIGSNGGMTQTQPTTGFLQILGIAINTTTLFLHLQEPIRLL